MAAYARIKFPSPARASQSSSHKTATRREIGTWSYLSAMTEPQRLSLNTCSIRLAETNNHFTIQISNPVQNKLIISHWNHSIAHITINRTSLTNLRSESSSRLTGQIRTSFIKNRARPAPTSQPTYSQKPAACPQPKTELEKIKFRLQLHIKQTTTKRLPTKQLLPHQKSPRRSNLHTKYLKNCRKTLWSCRLRTTLTVRTMMRMLSIMGRWTRVGTRRNSLSRPYRVKDSTSLR